MKRYLIYPAVLLLAACTSGPVEDMPETARLVAVSFSKPDLGVPVVLTRTDEAPVPVLELVPLPEGATVRIRAYFRWEASRRRQTFLRLPPPLKPRMRWKPTGACRPARWMTRG